MRLKPLIFSRNFQAVMVTSVFHLWVSMPRIRKPISMSSIFVDYAAAVAMCSCGKPIPVIGKLLMSNILGFLDSAGQPNQPPAPAAANRNRLTAVRQVTVLHDESM